LCVSSPLLWFWSESIHWSSEHSGKGEKFFQFKSYICKRKKFSSGYLLSHLSNCIIILLKRENQPENSESHREREDQAIGECVRWDETSWPAFRTYCASHLTIKREIYAGHCTITCCRWGKGRSYREALAILL